MASVDNSFTVRASNLHELFATSGRAFYVPPYQRPFTWGTDEFQRLIADICDGLVSFANDEQAITFLGSIICLKDELHDQIEPAIQDHLPSEVLVIIDGQQRLTTVAVLAAVLHRELQSLNSHFPASAPSRDAAESLIQSLLHRLQLVFIHDFGYGENKLAPKIIRAYEDVWGRTNKVAAYSSPVAHFLSAYIDFMKQPQGKFTYAAGKERPAVIERAHSELRKLCKAIRRGDPPEDINFPEVKELSRAGVGLRLFGREIPENVRELIADPTSAMYSIWAETLRLVALSNYFLDRCAVAFVRPHEERWAFDMFEALNTTGQQLTAYETFKPLVVKAESLGKFGSSPSKARCDEIDDYIPDTGKYEERERATNALLVPFALAEDGTKLSKRLGAQRHWLRVHFDGLPDLAEKRAFMDRLSRFALFLQRIWRGGIPATDTTRIPGAPEPASATAAMCIEYLKKANHTITIAPLALYYSRYLEQSADPEVECKRSYAKDLADLVMSVAAFFTLWRCAESTKGLDQVYRTLVEEKLCHSKHGSQPLPSIDELRKWFVERLASIGVGDRESWVRKVKTRAIYSDNKLLTRFALLAAHHNAIEDPQVSGLVIRGKEGVSPQLVLSQWLTEPSVEHVCPQTPGADDGWDEGITASEAVHSLGNLTLLPAGINSSVGNKGWSTKRLYFEALSSKEDNVDEVIASAVPMGVTVSANSVDVMKKSSYLPIVASLARVEKWDEAFVAVRSRRLAELAWDTLADWLGL